ncbi:MAG: hypothetical protein WCW77_05995 [Patescibacteria group bacterium]|jgi:hypothetical protein
MFKLADLISDSIASFRTAVSEKNWGKVLFEGKEIEMGEDLPPKISELQTETEIEREGDLFTEIKEMLEEKLQRSNNGPNYRVRLLHCPCDYNDCEGDTLFFSKNEEVFQIRLISHEQHEYIFPNRAKELLNLKRNILEKEIGEIDLILASI